jgi:septal ring factor EnvC (AmiA/AmiB activator)
MTLVVRADESEGILRQKQELEQIQRDVEDGQRRLDSLQEAERQVQDAINSYDEKIASDRHVLRRLGRELDDVRAGISRGDSILGERRVAYDRQQRRYLGNIRQFYTVAQSGMKALSDHPNEELEHYLKITYLTALADFESSIVQDASELVSETVSELDGMSGRQKMITGLKKDRETSYALGKSQKQRQEKSLNQLKRKSMAEADRIIMLRQAAQEMQEILARLEAERARQARPGQLPGGPSVFAALKGQLLSPFRGKIIHGFGEHVDPTTRLKSFSPGIQIKGRVRGAVYGVASGTVAYSGSLRGYGNFVIINHDHQYYSTYAGLGEILVSEGQFVRSRSKLGTSGKDGLVKFELREGREPLDPVKWIKIESL